MPIKQRWQYIILVLFGIIIVWYIYRNPKLFTCLRRISLHDIIALILLRGFALVVNGVLLKDFAYKFAITLKVKEWLGLSFVTAMGNYVTPFSGGMVFRAAYLHRNYGLSIEKFAMLLAFNFLIGFLCVAVVGLAGSIFIFCSSPELSWLVPSFFLSIILGISGLFFLKIPQRSETNWLCRKMNEAIAGWEALRSDRNFVWRLVGYTFINIFINSVLFFLAYQSIGVDISFLRALVISLITVFSLIINITPGNFGVQEVIISMASSSLGQGTGEGLVVSLIIRATSLILIFTFGPIFLAILLKHQSKSGFDAFRK